MKRKKNECTERSEKKYNRKKKSEYKERSKKNMIKRKKNKREAEAVIVEKSGIK